MKWYEITAGLILAAVLGGCALTPSPSPTGRGENALTPSAGSGQSLVSFPQEAGHICQEPVCILEVQFPFQRPIRPPGTDTVDATYRYGSTQNGQREVHRGVEFINKAGVPIFAAADGVVVFAGEDDQVSFASKRGFYGKVIILKHRVAGIALPVYTVYGHVLKALVQEGESVDQGQLIAEVGLGGVAAGTHLHFEVRYGQNDYQTTRNPELCLPPALAESGVLIGRFLDSQGNCLEIENVVLEPLGVTDAVLKRRYLATYEDEAMRCLPPWGESFGINDLPAGHYRLSYIYTKPEAVEIEIQAGKVTYLTVYLP